MKKIAILCFVVAVILLGIGLCLSIFTKADDNKQDVVKEETEIDVLEKVNRLENYFTSKIPIGDISKLSNQEKLNFALFCLNNEEGLSVSEDKIKNVLVSYFGNDLEFKNENILDLNTQEIIAKYYPKKKKYTYTDVTLDYPDTSLTLLSYGDYKEEKNTFEVYRQYLFVDASYNIYSTYQDYINKTNSLGVYDVSTTNGVLTSSIVNNYIDILPVVTYSFKKEQNRYVLVSIN